MNLDEAQRNAVAEWVKQGAKLSEIQNRLSSEFGLRLTYMEVRLLVDDLKLTPKDADPPKPAVPLATGPAQPPAGARPAANASPTAAAQDAEPAAAPSRVAVKVDQVTRPGALVSGKVTFSDGNRADWYLDQTGRLGLVAQKPNYRPPAADVQEFQMALEGELSKLGF